MIVLRGIAWEHPRGIGGIRAASEAWAGETEGVKVRWEPRSLLSFGDTPLADLAEGRDLLVVDHPNLAAAVAEGAVAPLDDLLPTVELAALADRFIGPSLASYLVDGRLAALPVDAAAQVSALRPDLIPAAPTSWDEVSELAAEGRIIWPGAPVDAYSSLCTLLAQAGSPIVGDDGSPPDGDALDRGLEVLRMLTAASAVPPLSLNPIAAAEELAHDDRIAYAPLLFGYTNYSRDGFRARRLAYRDVPGVTGSLLGGAGIAVSAHSPRPRLAASVALRLASADLQCGPWFAGGGQPARGEVWDDPALDAATLGFFSGTRRTLDAAWVRPAHPGYPAVQARIAALLARHLAGELGASALHSAIPEAVDQLREPVDARR